MRTLVSHPHSLRLSSVYYMKSTTRRSVHSFTLLCPVLFSPQSSFPPFPSFPRSLSPSHKSVSLVFPHSLLSPVFSSPSHKSVSLVFLHSPHSLLSLVLFPLSLVGQSSFPPLTTFTCSFSLTHFSYILSFHILFLDTLFIFSIFYLLVFDSVPALYTRFS